MAENLLRLPQRKRLPFRRAGFDRDTNAETAGQGCVPVPLRRSHRIEKWKKRAFTRLGGERLRINVKPSSNFVKILEYATN